jgi:hypothetical protein
VIEVSDAAEAISMLKAMPVDVVITDLRMSAVAHRSAAVCACLREPSPLLVTLSPSTFLHPLSEEQLAIEREREIERNRRRPRRPALYPV